MDLTNSRRKPMMEHREADEYMELEDEEEEHEYYFPHVEVVEIDEGLDISARHKRLRYRPGPGPAPRKSPGTKPCKMYELDPTVYPEAAAARASYENRIRKKAEKNKMLEEMERLRQRNKELEDENKLLKEQLSNVGAVGSKFQSFI